MRRIQRHFRRILSLTLSVAMLVLGTPPIPLAQAMVLDDYTVVETAMDWRWDVGLDPAVESQGTFNPRNGLHWDHDTFPYVAFKPVFDATATPLLDYDAGLPLAGYAYCVDRSANTTPVVPDGTATPPMSMLPARIDMSPMDGWEYADWVPVLIEDNGMQGLDIAGWQAQGGYAYSVPGMTVPYEGVWNLHVRSTGAWASTLATAYGVVNHSTFGIDVTPPSAVASLTAIDGGGAVVPNMRRTFRWNNPYSSGAGYDALSGDSRWAVKVNGVRLNPPDDSDADYEYVGDFANNLWSPYASLSVSSFRPGQNTFEVACVDYAGNVGPYTAMSFISDPDTPTITFTSPAIAGEVIGASPRFSASATDLAGITNVEFYFDGGPIGSDIEAPYEVDADLSGMPDGIYTVEAVATDHYGRSATTSRTVNLVKNPPPPPFDEPNLIVWDFGSQTAWGMAPTETANPMLWSNDTYPIFGFSTVNSVNGFVYSFDHAAGTLPVMPTPGVPGNAYVSAASVPATRGTIARVLMPGGTPGVDLPGWSQYVAPSWLPGMTDPVEGLWYGHSRAVLDGAYGPASHELFGIDITPPTPITGLTVSDLYGGVIPTMRRDILWDNLAFGGTSYDALSGDWMYYVEVNGEPMPTNSDVHGVIPIQSSFQYASASIEDLPPGRNTIGVGVIDRASNLSSLVTTTFYSDPDTPTITVLRPTETETMGVPAQFSVEASDRAGIVLVEFRVDGQLIGADSTAPYDIESAMLPFLAEPAGPRMLSVTAYDLYGRAAVKNQGFIFDPLALPPPDPSTLPIPTEITHEFVGQDWAGNRTIPTGDMSTDTLNPYLWTNDLHPGIGFKVPSDRAVAGFVYSADKVAGSVPQMPLPGLNNAFVSAATALATYGVEAQVALPSGEWGMDLSGWASYGPVPLEGLWYVHARSYRDGEYGDLAEFPFGVDLTDPGPITGLVHADSVVGTLPISRRDFLWNNPTASGPPLYDALSGDWAYYIEVDGQPIETEFDIAGAIPVELSHDWASISVEDLRPGWSTIGIGVIDRAGNLGSLVTTTVCSDPDTPTIVSLGTDAGTVSALATVSAETSDLAGIHRVEFAVDGVPVGTAFAEPFQVIADLSGFGDGTRVLYATAYDLYGRSVTATEAFDLIKYPPAAPFDAGTYLQGTFVAPDGFDHASPDVDNPIEWISDLYPDISFMSTRAVNGFAYSLDHSATATPTVPVPGVPGNAYVSAASLPATLGTSASVLLPSGFPGVDMLGWSSYTLPAWLPGMTQDVEGVWYLHARTYLDGAYGPVSDAPFGIDVTDPGPITGLGASDGYGAAIPISRRDIVWDNPAFTGGSYDGLSGDWMYYVQVNGEPMANGSSPAGVVPILNTHEYGTVSIEDLPAGENTVSVGVIDRAGNLGPLTHLAFVTDLDTPTVEITRPATDGETLGLDAVFEAGVTEAGRIASVVFSIDGTSVATQTVAPFAIQPDLSAYADGPHTLTVTVTDAWGRSVTATRTFDLLKYPPAPPFDAVTFPHGTFISPDGFDHALPDANNPLEWISDLYPDISFEATRDVNGFAYSLDHSATATPTVPVPGDPTAAYVSAASLPATIGKTASILMPSGFPGLDMPGWASYIMPSSYPGVVEPVEGVWYLHSRALLDGQFGPVTSIPFGIDVTDPGAVTGLGASDAYGAVVPTSRRNILWDNPTYSGSAYDALSGDWTYYVEVNGEPMANGSTPAGMVSILDTHEYGTVSIEDLPAGENTVSVGVIDRAGNLGPLTHLAFVTDPDTPTVEITRPGSDGTTIGVPAKFAAEATDAAGISSVEFRVGAVLISTDFTAPYEAADDLAAFADGPQVLTVTARDRYGRAVSATRTFNLDKTAPPPPDPSTLLVQTKIEREYVGAEGVSPAATDSAHPVEWTNDRYPVFAFETTRPVNGFAYVVDRTLGTVPQVTVPGLENAYVSAAALEGTAGTTAQVLLPNGTPGVDLPGWNGYWAPAPFPGAVDPIEGMWYMHARSYWSGQYGQLAQYEFGVDVTDPDPVTGLAPADSIVGTMTASRRDFTWDNPVFTGGAYDDLSGDWLYYVELNGVPIETGHSVLGAVPVLEDHGYGTVSIEDFANGRNDVSVGVIDRAGNVGPLTTYTFYRDADTPTVSITEPAYSGAVVTATPTFSAVTSDLAGIHRVEFMVDATPVGTDFIAPYSIAPDLSGFPDGAHVLYATAYDLYGRSVTASLPFTLLKYPPLDAPTTLSGTFVSPDGLGHADPDVNHPFEWVNDLYPDIRFQCIRDVNGFVYSVDHTSGTLPLLPVPGVTGNAYVSAASLPGSVGVQASVLLPSGQPGLDMLGWSTYVPPVWLPGVNEAVEGLWYVHARTTVDGRYGQATHALLGVDVTDPGAVTGLRPTDDMTPTVPYARRDFVWDNPTFTGGSYDALSGDWMYYVELNGEPIRNGSSPAGLVPIIETHQYGVVSLEDIPPGQNTVSVGVVDRAGNLGPLTGVSFYSDPDTPTVEIVQPSGTATVGPILKFSANATDVGGIESMTFRVDSTVMGTDTTAPYDLAVNLNPFLDGPHTLYVTVVDHYGRSVTVSRAFVLDKTAPPPVDPSTLLIDTSIDAIFSPPDGFGQALVDTDHPLEWTSDPFPDIAFETTRPVNGFAYVADHTFGTLAVMPAPGAPGRAYVSAASLPETVGLEASVLMPSGFPGLDLPGWSTYTMPVWLAGMQDPSEGLWIVHARAVNSGQYGTSAERTFGLDITDPAPVTNLRATDSIVGTVTTARRDFVWDNPSFAGGSYDSLSGDWMYYAEVNGVPVTTQTEPYGAFPVLPAYPYGSISVEDLPAGRVTVAVGVIDRAGNLGPMTEMTFYSDPDTPTLEITEPAADGTTLTVSPTFSAEASDRAGISRVTFTVDSTLVATDLFAPYTVQADLSTFTEGWHTLTVTAVDTYGRAVTRTRTFYLDLDAAPPPDPSTLDVFTNISGTFVSPDNVDHALPDAEHPTEWINDLYPDFSFASTQAVNGFVYSFDHDPATLPVLPEPDLIGNAYVSAASMPATMGMDADVLLPSGQPGVDIPGWGTYTVPSWIPGMHDPLEGIWYVHARAVRHGAYGMVRSLPFGIDITDPLPVTGLRASDAGGAVIGTARRDFVWNNPTFSGGSYDELSGDWMYYVMLNGVPIDAGTGVDGMVPIIDTHEYGVVSIEDLPPGRNVISVGVVDRAGNIGPMTSITFWSDPDAPTVRITKPATDNSYVMATYKFSAETSDKAGIQRVDFRVDGVLIGADTAAPYEVTKDMTAFTNGGHTLTVTATDLFGRTATAARPFILDKTLPVLSSINDTPDPFYPVIREGYKDNSTVYFTTNEGGTAYLNIYTGSGAFWRQVKKTVNAGSNTIVWDGKSTSGLTSTGTFYYRVAVYDAAGNGAWSAKYLTTIRNYELVPVAGGGVKVVPR